MNSSSGSAGRMLLIPKGDYNSAVTYSMLDMVTYGSSSYVCKLQCTNIAPSNTTYWQLIASGGNTISDAEWNQIVQILS